MRRDAETGEQEGGGKEKEDARRDAADGKDAFHILQYVLAGGKILRGAPAFVETFCDLWYNEISHVIGGGHDAQGDR